MQTPMERIWEGRLHLGDEPGVYGDAAYAGLAAELPFTLRRFREGASEDDVVEIIVEAQDVRTFEGYLGHHVIVMGYEANPLASPEWQSRVLARGRLERNSASVELRGDIPETVSLRVQVDTDVAPGLYDDFILRRISLRSSSHYASLGFRAGA
jgi:hypothetical protein